jgi:hypothetical protein
MVNPPGGADQLALFEPLNGYGHACPSPRLGHKNVDEVRSLLSGKLESILTLNIGPR